MNQIKNSISSLPKKQLYKFYVYSKLIRNDTRFKRLKLLLGTLLVKLINFMK